MRPFRPVNQNFSATLKFGPFNSYQFFALIGLILIVFYFQQTLGFSLTLAAFLIAFLFGLITLFLGDKPWLFLGWIVPVPYLVRFGVAYQPLLKESQKS